MELDDLYQEVLLDHYRHPRGAAPVSDRELVMEEVNPACGDHLRLAFELRDGHVVQVRHESRGCAISIASASIMAAFVEGRTPAEIRAAADGVIAMMRGESDLPADGPEDLAALAGVRQFPMRIKCATMCWHAMKAALDRQDA